MAKTKATFVIGLGFGDEGKGCLVDWLCKSTGAKMVVRYNGGAQAAHNVTLTGGLHHTFCQVGSGALRGAHTYLHSGVFVDPFALDHELNILVEKGQHDIRDRIMISADCPVITVYHVALNRAREFLRRGYGKLHGSCATGAGEAVMHSLCYPDEQIIIDDLSDHKLLTMKLKLLRNRLIESGDPLIHLDQPLKRILETESNSEHWADRLANLRSRLHVVNPTNMIESLGDGEYGDFIVEGAQGVLLDETVGFFPHTTWSSVLPISLMNELDALSNNIRIETIGVTRAYHTRHGNGPFPTQFSQEDSYFHDEHNHRSLWQGDFRSGALDLVLLKYACFYAEPDKIAVTCIDHLPTNYKVCQSYELTHLGNHSTITIDSLPTHQHLCSWPESAQIEHQMNIGRILEMAEPQYQVYDHPSSAGSLNEAIQNATGIPVSLNSSEPGLFMKVS